MRSTATASRTMTSPASPLRSPRSRARHTESLADQAHALIQRDIITMRLRPGEALNEADLIVRTGIGRTPVHQAVQRLVIEGMLTVMPRKGVMVRPVSLDDVLSIIDVRLVNEGHCVELAARHAQADDYARMAGLLDDAQAVIAEHDVEAMMEIDREFHLAISAAARNPVLAEILRGLHERSLRFWFITLSEPHHLAGVQHEHAELFERLRERDAAGARRSVERHIEAFRSTLLQHLRT